MQALRFTGLASTGRMTARARTGAASREASWAFRYPKPGKYTASVKVIDIFGNDTTKVVEVKV